VRPLHTHNISERRTGVERRSKLTQHGHKTYNFAGI
jgi:hypothetical protein